MKFAAEVDTEIHLPNCYGVLNAYRKRPFTNSTWEKESDSEWCRAVLQRTRRSDMSALLGAETVSMEVLEELENHLEPVYRELACLEYLGT